MQKKIPKRKRKLNSRTSPFTTQIYAHVRAANKAWVKRYGKAFHGSESAYIDSLISKDRGIKPTSGLWLPK